MEESLTKISLAEKYTAMADKIQLGRFKEKYYLLALKALDDADDESMAEQREIIARKLNEARAAMVIEKYDFACKSREYAKTSEDQGSAALHFREAMGARSKISVEEQTLPQNIRDAYDETIHAEEYAAECEKKSRVTYQVGRVKMLVGIVLVIVLVVGIWTGRKTVTLNTAIGNVFSAVGMKTSAVDYYRFAYERHADDTTYAKYMNGLYEAGMSELRKGDSEEAQEYLHLPALNGFQDAAEYCTMAELELLAEKKVGDEASFAGCEWYVLGIEDDSVLLLKKDGVASGAFQCDSAKGWTWADSELRAYLNGAYICENLNLAEQKQLIQNDIVNEDNAVYGTEGGENTQDYVYILSVSEVEEYGELVNHCGHLTWLRTPGATEGTMAFRNVDETIMDAGYNEATDTIYTKPVIRVSLKTTE